ASRQGDRLVMTAGGAWVIGAARELDRTLRQVEVDGARAVVLDLAGVAALDTAGAWLVRRTQRRLEKAGRSFEIINLGDTFAPLYHQVVESDAVPPLPNTLPPPYRFGDFLARIGHVTVGVLERAGNLLGFVGLVCIVGLRTLRHPSRLRVSALFAQMEHAGVDALPIVGLLAFLVGVVFAFQGADQLRRLGAEIYTVNLLGVVILRELGVLITAIILAGRSGSAFTAQIGTMMVNEEIDAMTILGLDPVEVLVLPRLLAMLLTLPLVAFYANVMGLVGGALMSWQALDISIPTFLRQLHSSIPGWTFWIGVLKAPTFAGIIAVTGCYEGLRVTRSAESVGRLTTRSVVESIFLIIAADALFTVIFAYLNI
ncbi:MAG: MlaE family lipid ABC transporter permease subunit, partial [Alphaproteobacteria bacterium]|nr:MlaE family lipid ABC transporter permease subunit [Alphaproteobacteria bacterium]